MAIESISPWLVTEKTMIKNLCKLAFVLALIVVTLGALTRLMDAGLGCPDWPGCYGQVIPPEHGTEIDDAVVHGGKAWMEMIHRYAASALGLIILIIAFKIQSDKTVSNNARWLSRFLLLLVIVQGLFGMWTVTLKLLPQIVTLHLLGGFAVLSLLFLLILLLSPARSISGNKKPVNLAMLVLILLSAQIALGGWTSSNYAGLACTDFPTCDGQLLPPLDLEAAFHLTEFSDRNYEGGLLEAETRVTIQYTHRVVALIVFTFLLILFVRLLQLPELRGHATMLLGFTVLQVMLGITTAIMMLPLPLALAHNTGAALLLLEVIYINYALSPNNQNVAIGSTTAVSYNS